MYPATLGMFRGVGDAAKDICECSKGAGAAVRDLSCGFPGSQGAFVERPLLAAPAMWGELSTASSTHCRTRS